MSSFGEGRRYELAILLQAMREQAGLTQAEVAAELMWSTSKMSRLEGGQKRPILSDLLLLLPLYQIPTAQHAAIIQLARNARATPLYASFRDILDDGEITYYEALGDADCVRESSGPLIPQVLRTREYDTIVKAATHRSTAPERWLGLMTEVQRSLQAHTPDTRIYVLDESALRRQVGNRSVMRNQRDHLDHLAEHCKILVVPFAAGAFEPDFFTLLTWKNEPTATMLALPARLIPPMRINRDTRAIKTAETMWSQLISIAKPLAHMN